MAIPDFQSIMLPLLQLMQDGQEHTQADLREALAAQFHLTSSELSEMLPSGIQRRFDNRVAWTKSYLVMAGILVRSSRGIYSITERGRQVLNQNPTKMDRAFLMQFPEFAQRQPKTGNRDEPHIVITPITQTPEEALGSSYQTLRQSLAQDILARVKQITPQNFERLVVDLLLAMGYGGSRSDAGQAVGQSGDGGIDGTIKEDKLGLDVIYIQAKRWENTVGRPDVQAFVGSLEGKRARKGVFITTSQFSNEAHKYVSNIGMKVVLLDGEQLAELMIDHGIGVTEVANYVVKRVDQDYFSEE